MAETDVAVRYDSKTMRLVTSGEKAGLFDKSGLVKTLSVVVEATAPGRMPTLEDENGAVVTLGLTGKPCSCTGAPWNLGGNDLRTKLA